MSIHAPEYSLPPPALRPRPDRWGAILESQLLERGKALNFVLLGLLSAAVLLSTVVPFYIATLFRGGFGPGVSARLFFIPFSTGVWFFLLVLLSSSVGAGIVSRDLASRSLTLYLARPITRFDYLVAKSGAVAAWIFFGAVIPSSIGCFIVLSLGYASLPLALQGFGGDLAVGLLAVTAFTGISVFLSSLSSRSALAGAGIFGVLIGSEAVAVLLAAISNQPSFGYLSPDENLIAVASGAFGVGGDPLSPWVAAVILIGFSATTFFLAYWRLEGAEVVPE
ncbi:MAG: ABC transporter permease subunit [Thermoplasmata archaeon]|nr:ABC transporter permease subunit [Thermoplasmata archaeon]